MGQNEQVELDMERQDVVGQLAGGEGQAVGKAGRDGNRVKQIGT